MCRCVCDVFCVCVFVVCVSFCMLLYTSTHLPASIWMSFPICRAFSNPPKFITLEHNILVQNGPSPMSPHISLFKQGPRYRTSPEKHKVFLCVSFVFLEFWNHACTAAQGFSYITITGGSPTRWKLKEYAVGNWGLYTGEMIQEVGQTYFVPKDPSEKGETSPSLKRSSSGAWN